MKKLSDPDFALPEIHALTGDQIFTSGTNTPMLIRGICSDKHEKVDYVVKYKGAERMYAGAMGKELFAALIALELDIHVAEPAIILITPEFVNTLIGKEGYRVAAQSVGLNYGCKYYPGYITLIKNQGFSKALFKKAEAIFTYDVFISNPDRNDVKNNMLVNGDDILIFDHEVAFSFLLSLVRNPTPWILNDEEMRWISKHYFYQILKGNEHNFDIFVDKFTRLDRAFWLKLEEVTPNEWLGDRFSVLQENLSSIIENREIFKQELHRILS